MTRDWLQATSRAQVHLAEYLRCQDMRDRSHWFLGSLIPENFRRLALGSIDAEVCKQILIEKERKKFGKIHLLESD